MFSELNQIQRRGPNSPGVRESIERRLNNQEDDVFKDSNYLNSVDDYLA